MVQQTGMLLRSAIIAICAGLVSGAATIAVNDFKVNDLRTQFSTHVTQSDQRHDRIEKRVRLMEIETSADIREIKTILQRMEQR